MFNANQGIVFAVTVLALLGAGCQRSSYRQVADGSLYRNVLAETSELKFARFYADSLRFYYQEYDTECLGHKTYDVQLRDTRLVTRRHGDEGAPERAFNVLPFDGTSRLRLEAEGQEVSFERADPQSLPMPMCEGMNDGFEQAVASKPLASMPIQDEEAYRPPRSPLFTEDLRRAVETCRRGECNTDSTAAQVEAVLDETMRTVYAFKNRLPEWQSYVRRSDEAWRRYRDEECQLSIYETFEGQPTTQDDEMYVSCQMTEAAKRIDDLAYFVINPPHYLSEN